MGKMLLLGLFVIAMAVSLIQAADQKASPVERITHVAGRVASTDGKPIVGATVWWQGPTPRGVVAPTGSRTTTDKEGRFRVPIIVSDPDKTSKECYLVGTGFDVFAEGFVRFQERLPVEELVVSDLTKDSPRDFVLLPGEIIEGEVRVKAFEGFMNYITVRGPSFRQTFTADLDGKFQFWVPKGEYTLSVLDGKSRGLNLMRRELSYAAKDVKKPVEVNVVSGTKGIIVKD